MRRPSATPHGAVTPHARLLLILPPRRHRPRLSLQPAQKMERRAMSADSRRRLRRAPRPRLRGIRRGQHLRVLAPRNGATCATRSGSRPPSRSDFPPSPDGIVRRLSGCPSSNRQGGAFCTVRSRSGSGSRPAGGSTPRPASSRHRPPESRPRRTRASARRRSRRARTAVRRRRWCRPCARRARARPRPDRIARRPCGGGATRCGRGRGSRRTARSWAAGLMPVPPCARP